MKKLIIVSLSAGLLLALALLSGCGSAPSFGTRPTDIISGHWVVTQQSSSLTGARVAATVAGEFSILYTFYGVPSWSGKLTDTGGGVFDPNFGEWSKKGAVYTISNAASQSLQFVFDGAQLRSSTRSGGSTVYLWWSRT